MKNLGFLRFSAIMRPEIRSLALYPDELRAHTRFSAVSGRFHAPLRQSLNGTERKQTAQWTHSAAQNESQCARQHLKDNQDG